MIWNQSFQAHAPLLLRAMCASVICLNNGIAAISDSNQLKRAVKGRSEACCLPARDQDVVARLELISVLGIALALQLQETKTVLLLSLTDITVGRCI